MVTKKAKKSENNDKIEIDKHTNFKNVLYEAKQQKTHLKTYPYRLYIELTRNCNMKCRMCYGTLTKLKKYDPKFNMSFHLFKKIADHLFPYAKFVDLRGFGESTLLPNFRKYLDYALRFDCDFGLITNLTLKDDALWGHLIKNDFWVGISIDGPDKKTYGKIRDKKYFDQVISNIKLLVDLSKRYKKDPGKIYFLVVVQQANIRSLPKLIKLAKKIGIKRIEFKRVFSNDKNIILRDSEPKRELARKKISQSLELAKKYSINLVLTGTFFDYEFEKKLGYNIVKRCQHPWSHLYISCNGFAGPCNGRPDLQFIELTDKTLADFKSSIRNHPKFKNFRKTVNSSNKPKFCDFCFSTSFGNEFS